MHHIHHHQHRHPVDRAIHAGHMEHFSKRRRVERRSAESALERHDALPDHAEGMQFSLPEQDGVALALPKLVLPPHGDKTLEIIGSSPREPESPLERLDPTRLPVPKLELRQNLPSAGQAAGPVAGAVGGAAAPVASVVNGVVGNVPAAASLSQPPANNAKADNPPSPTPPSTKPGNVQPPAAVAAQEARSSALAVEQSQAKEDDRLPPPPPSASTPSPNEPSSPAAAASAPAAQNSMSIQVPGIGSSSQQQILSSPPTPLPATPDASANPSPSSYFTSSPASAGISASSGLLPAPSNAPSINKSSSTNSTVSSTSMTASVTSSASGSSNSASSSIDAALLASLSSSQASLDSLSTSITGFNSLTASGSLTGSLASPTTMATFASGTDQSGSATGSGAANGGAGGVGGATGTTGAPAATSSTSGSGGGSSTPAMPALIGGIVGGISGLVLILLAALLLLRYRKGRLGMGERRTISPPMLQTSGEVAPPTSGTGTTGTQRSSTAPIVAAGLFGRLRPSSSQTATTADTVPSERGFQKISGRKLPSVLTSGGDGYGEKVGAGAVGAAAVGAGAGAASKGGHSAPQQKGLAPGQGPFAGLAPALRPSPPHSLSGSSFYRDSRGFYGGVVPESNTGSGATEPSGSPTSSSPTFPSPLAIAGGAKDPGTPSRKPTMRPGPARTPVINTPGAVPPPRPIRGTPPPTGVPPHSRDLLGRSHPSEDGSRTSRFRESTTPP